MFERIRKALTREAPPPPSRPQTASNPLHQPVQEWASRAGFAISNLANDTIAMDARVAGKPWRLELGKATRNYVRGDELRGRAELGLHEDLAVLIMNRPLKEALERKAYSMITDTLQTTADPSLPEEMRWLAMFEEVGWDTLPPAFWRRYAVMTDRREHAMAWIDALLAQQLLEWPQPAPSAETPFLIILLRGKAYLRMEYSPAEVHVFAHAVEIFTNACESAIGGLGDSKLV